MSCSFFKMFYPDSSLKETIELIESNYKDGGLEFWKKKYISDTETSDSYVKAYQPSSVNLSSIIGDYMDSVSPLRVLTGYEGELTQEEIDKLNKFYEINKWDDMFKGFMRDRKLLGDSYTSIALKDIKGYGIMPILRTLPNRYMDIVESPNFRNYQFDSKDLDRDIQSPSMNGMEYILEYTKSFKVRIEGTTNTESITKEIKLVFTTGKVIPFVNGVQVVEDTINYVGTELAEIIPILHLQFMKEPDSPFSEIPSLSYIDDCIRLDRIETNIAETNNQSGSPQIIAIDGNFDKKSEFGAKAIAYVDTTNSALKAGKQAQVKQLEITNGLESLNSEASKTINSLYNKANLIPPSIQETLAKSNSGKVVRFYSQDLLNENKKGYDEISQKTAFLWKILFPHRANQPIRLKVPNDIHASTLYDKIAYVQGGIMTLQEFKESEGANPEEVKKFINDMGEQQILFGKVSSETDSKLSIEKIEGVDGQSSSSVRDNNPDKATSDVEGLDNRMKT